MWTQRRHFDTTHGQVGLNKEGEGPENVDCSIYTWNLSYNKISIEC